MMSRAQASTLSREMAQFVPPADQMRSVLDGAPEEKSGGFAATVAAEVAAHDFFVLPLADYCENYEEFRAACMQIANALGHPMVQNEAGDRVIEVFDRRKGRIEEGARYHQTRQGGDIHTDSVNRPEPMKFLLLGCAAPAVLGGESILIRGSDVLDRLRDFPGVVETLSRPYHFEGRGMAEIPGLFQMPVLTETETGPSFRYLRPYIESAHLRAGEPLDAEQTRAFDVLDACLDLSELQYRYSLQKGDLLISDDTAVFHGRTSFIDGPLPGAWTPGRCMLRYWID